MSLKTVLINTVLALSLAVTINVPTLAATSERVVDFTVYSSEDRVPLYEAFFAAFEKKTGIKVKFLQSSGNQVQKWEQVITQVAGGLSPDVVGAVSVEFVQYASKGLIQPVDDYIKQDKVSVKQIIPILIEALQWRGKQYMMPYGASALTLVYNTQLFDEAGVPYPPNEWNHPSWTWDTFLAVMKKLTMRDGNGNVTRLGLGGPPMDSWMTLPYNWGGDWIDGDMKRFTGNQPGALAALQAMQDLRWTHGVMGTGGGLLQGTAAMAGQGTWGLKSLLDSTLPLRFSPWFKVGNNQPKGPINPMGLALLASGQHKAEAWEFVKFATLDPVGNYLFATAAGALPGTPVGYRNWQDSLLAQRPKMNPVAFVQQVAETGAIVRIRKVTTYNEINTIMNQAVANVLANTKSPTQAMEEAAPVVQALIDQSEH